MQYFNSIIFFVFINLWGMIIPIIYFPAIIFNSAKLADHGAKVWSVVGLKVLKWLCKIDFEVLGKENIPKNSAIIACKHQSMWETIVMHLLIKRPVYAFKKELKYIPFYGWFLFAMSGITVDRKGGVSSIKSIVNQAKKYLNKNQIIVIFPQGTRVPIGESVEKYPYQSGITAIYQACKVEVVPVALNSGRYWPKHQLLKTPGIIKIKFLPAIPVGLDKKQFINTLQNSIESACADLD